MKDTYKNLDVTTCRARICVISFELSFIDEKWGKGQDKRKKQFDLVNPPKPNAVIKK